MNRMTELHMEPDRNNLSLMDALNQAVDGINRNYGCPWVAPADHGVRRLEWTPAAERQFEIIHEPHWHLFLELCVCLKGQCAIRHEEYVLQLNENEACLVMPKVVHSENAQQERSL